jgi:hypothetical protein
MIKKKWKFYSHLKLKNEKKTTKKRNIFLPILSTGYLKLNNISKKKERTREREREKRKLNNKLDQTLTNNNQRRRTK